MRALFGLGVASALLLGAAASAQPSEPITVRENRQTLTRSCAGRDVVVAGNRNRVQLTGGCRSVAVLGNDNAVTAEMHPGGAVSTPGNRNAVTLRVAGGGAAPWVENLGTGNTVTGP